MQFYWSLKDIPELSSLPAKERRRIWTAANWQALQHWQAWVALLSCGLIAFLGTTLGEKYGHENIGSAVGFVLAISAYMQLMTSVALPYIRKALAEKDTRRTD